jgi:glutathionyl-hydroquinone reductase
MALLYYHHDISKMKKKSSQAYYSHKRRYKYALVGSLICNITLITLITLRLKGII